MIVVAAPELSAAASSGGELRTKRLVQALAEDLPVGVVVVGSVDDPRRLAEELGAPVEVFPRLTSAWAKRRVAVKGGLPLDAARAFNPAAAARIREWASEDGLVILENLRMAPYRPTGVRTVLSLQNHESALLEAQPRPGSALRRLEHHWNRWAMPRLERRLMDDPDVLTVVVSELDAKALSPVRCVVVPNGTDRPAAVSPPPTHGSVLFIASLGYPPNREAVQWWCNDVAQFLPEDFPPLTVVGRGWGPELNPLRDLSTVRFVGEVPDVQPYLQGARLVVAPLLSGGGPRLKVMEALAWGRALVATSKAVEGLDVVNDRDALLVDDARGFAAAVQSAYDDSDVNERLSGAGRARSVAWDWHYFTPVFVDAVREFWQEGASGSDVVS